MDFKYVCHEKINMSWISNIYAMKKYKYVMDFKYVCHEIKYFEHQMLS